MLPLARNQDFYEFLPCNNSEKTLRDSLHYANTTFLLSGKPQKYGRTDVVSAQGDVDSFRIPGGTVVWGHDDKKMAEEIVAAGGFVVVLSKKALGRKTKAAVDSLVRGGVKVFDLAQIKKPHRLVYVAGCPVMESYREVDGLKAFHTLPMPTVETEKQEQQGVPDARNSDGIPAQDESPLP